MIAGSISRGRIVGIFGPRVQIAADDYIVNAIVRGKIKYGSSGVSPIAVGDYVEFELKTKDSAAVEKILERKACISRPAVKKEGLLQVIVSNIDQLVIVISIVDPPLKPGLVDRYLVLAFKEAIHPVVVINKIDLASPSPADIYIQAWRKIGCDVLCTSAVDGRGVGELSRLMEKGTSVIAGHSGVGKSSILNYINPGLKIRTARLSSYSLRGVHTTSRVTLFRLFSNGWVADTPGLKDLGLAGITRRTLYRYFPEFGDLDANCQFDNCIHIREPGCAVKKALESGMLASFRYRDYLRIYESLK
jgi:ribosome biogenesis GTPase